MSEREDRHDGPIGALPPALPPELPPELPVVCRKLRAKAAYDAGVDGPTWKLGDSTTAAYWCLSTMEPSGPDDRLCHPHDCGEGRACYRAPDDAPAPHTKDPPRVA